ncbi:MAG TPA: leucine-rich repeat domain-containing protein [Verrucomicrobiales bacterium]|nr:leucine-rich repeat domain-containing protein [Verrucomicrobiales bacterium]
MNFLESLTALQYLELRGCKVMTSVDGLRGLSSLEYLNLSECEALTNVDNLKGIASLQYLNLNKSKKILKETWPALISALPRT